MRGGFSSKRVSHPILVKELRDSSHLFTVRRSRKRLPGPVLRTGQHGGLELQGDSSSFFRIRSKALALSALADEGLVLMLIL